MRSHDLRQLVDFKCVVSCQQTCFKYIVKNKVLVRLHGEYNMLV